MENQFEAEIIWAIDCIRTDNGEIGFLGHYDNESFYGAKLKDVMNIILQKMIDRNISKMIH